jgi:hypothetical protein
MSIELRLSNVDPPDPEPKRTIYRDIVNLPDPVKLGITIRYFNHDDVGLYFQITGSGTGYTFGTVNLGLLASGANAYNNLDEFASRAKPSASDLPNGEKEENITLILKAYTDSGYTNLKWTYERIVTIHWINSADASFTVDVLNNFDDGTVQGWAATAELNCTVILSVTTDYVLSAPYSLSLSVTPTLAAENRARIYKSFTTPNKDKVFAIINLRLFYSTNIAYQKYIQIQHDTTVLVKIGKYTGAGTNEIPADKWLRIVVPLPKNTTLELRIIYDSLPQYASSYPQLRMDDFKIISK